MTNKNCKENKETDQKDANYICKKCGRLAKKEKHLCKPKAIKK
jgi:hypothetical protein